MKLFNSTELSYDRLLKVGTCKQSKVLEYHGEFGV